MRTRVLILTVIIWSIFAGSMNLPAATAQPGAGWQAVEPGGATRCAEDTPYTFYTREGASDRLLLYFQGGGACWDGKTCSSTMYDRTVDETDDPALRSGVLDLANPENPFADHDIVYIPTCTGDVHVGNSVREYTHEGDTFTIYHNGFTNAAAALDWAYTHFDSPDSVFIMGCSAGSLGTIAHAPYILEQYAGVPAVHLGDAAGGYRGNAIPVLTAWDAIDQFPAWLPELANLTPETFRFELLYTVPAEAYPDTTFSQINRSIDALQIMFGAMLGLTPYQEALEVNHREIEAGAPNFRYYTAWGSGHCLVPLDEFYTVQTNGVRLRDWVAALADGTPVENVQCSDCSQAEFYEGE